MLARGFVRALIVGGTATRGDRSGLPSLTIDGELLDAADLDQLERVEVRSTSGDWHLDTFVLRGPHGRGIIRIDGEHSLLITDGDRITITAWSLADRTELTTVRARVVELNASNQIVKVREMRPVDE